MTRYSVQSRRKEWERRRIIFDPIDTFLQSQYCYLMITDADVKKLKAVFATKDDAKAQHDAVIIKLNVLEKHIASVDQGLETLNESLIPILGNLHEWTDEIHNAVVRERLLKRVKRLEKHLGLPTLVD